MAQSKILTFRVRNIPLEYEEETLKKALRQTFSADERVNILPMLALVPSFRPESQTQDALVMFHPKTPTFLDDVERDKTGLTERQISVDGRVINIDLNFFGLTQVSDRPRDGKVDIDLIFVTGLDGNAYGSWTSRTTGNMWPRQFLRDDLPKARVLTFGYNTKLSSNMSHTFEDFCTQFLSTVQLARKEAPNRPMVLLGHSYGARVIIKSIIKCKILDRNEFNKAFLESLKGLVFFGAPYHGMDTKDIETYLSESFLNEPTGEARKALLKELQKDNPAVERDLQDFKDLVGQQLKIRIISVYERKPGHKLIQIPQKSSESSGADANSSITWKRQGEAYNPLTKEDAVLGFPSWLEFQLPSDSDHSNMAKFDHKDTTYQLIIEELWKFTAKPMTKGFSYGSDTTKTPISKFQELRTLLKFNLKVLRGPCLILPGLEALGLELLQALVESQVLLELAENVLCRAIILKNEPQLVDIAITMRDKSQALELALQETESRLKSSEFPSNTDGAGYLHSILQSSLQFNTHLRTQLLEGIPGTWTPRSDFSRNKKVLNELISLRYAGDITIKSRIRGHLEPEWIPFERLCFPTEPEFEKDHEKESWLNKFIQFFTKSDSSDLKLKPRRFAALRTNDEFEKVMVEFCPCTEYISTSELSCRRQQLVNTARIMLQSNHSTTARLSTVPLRGVSYMDTSANRYFLIILKADDLVCLDEAFAKFDVPNVKNRVWLALRYAEFIATLHSACYCHGLINPFNLYLQISATIREHLTPFQLESTSPMLAGFDIARQVQWSSDLIDVEDPHWRIHLHPERMERGYDKERQDPRHDVFSLGMVMIEIGHWKLFSRFKKYQNAETEEKRQDHCIKLRKQFKGDGADNNMPGDYRDIISYCLGRSDFLPGQPVDAQQSRLLSELDEPKTSRVVDALSRLYESLP